MKLAGLAILMSLVAAPVLAQDVGDYPAAGDPATIAAWLGARTNIKPASVVTLTPGFVVAVAGEQRPLTPDGATRVTLREEVIAPSFIESVGGRSSLMTLEIQCEERRLRMDVRQIYAGPNLSGASEASDPSAEWLRIPDDSIMDEVADAACSTDFAWPLKAYASASAQVIAAQAPPAPPPVAPPSEPEPKPAVAEAEPAKPAVTSASRYAVQIGAYRNQAMAEAAWKALSTKRPVLTKGHDFGLRAVKVNGKDLLRGLVLNFSSAEESAQFCTALAGAGYGCILRTLTE